MTTVMPVLDRSGLETREKTSEWGLAGMTHIRLSNAFDVAERISTDVESVQYNKVQTRDLVNAVLVGLNRVKVICLEKSGEGDVGFVYSLKGYLRVLSEIEEALSRQARQGFLRKRLNRGDNLEELKQLDIGLSKALFRFLSLSQNEDGNIQQRSTTSLALSSTKDLSNVIGPAWAALWNSIVAPQGCLPGTRADVIEQMGSWIREPKPVLSMFWLMGLSGMGKSAIAKSVCEQIANRGDTVLVTFFASRSSKERSDPLLVLHGFLYKLAAADSTFRQHLLSNLPTNQDISQWTLSDQVDRLLKASLDAAYGSGDTAPRLVFVVDALDELEMTNGVDGQDLITHLVTALRGLPFKLIVTSRLETRLMNTFRTLVLDKSILDLHQIPDAVFADDIRKVYVHAFDRIALNRGVVESWPTEQTLGELVRRTGHFPLLAISTIRYVDNTQYSPIARLQQVLEPAASNDTSEDSPFLQVDLMYTEVLLHAVTSHESVVDLERCHQLRRMLRILVVVYPDDIDFNHLALLLQSPKSALRHDVDTLSSVLIQTSIGDDYDNAIIRIFHLSFRDFLMERCTDERFFIGDDQQLGDSKLLEDIQSFVRNRINSGHLHHTQQSSDRPEAVRLSPPSKSDVLSADKISSPVLSMGEMTADQLQAWLDDNPKHRLRSTAVRRLVELASRDDRSIPTGLLIRGVKQTDSQPVGGGAFADVFKGVYQEEDVAIKRLRTHIIRGDASKLTKRFYREAVIWRQLRHAQILSFLGVDGDALLENANAMGLVSPWMTQGTLLEYLKKPIQSSPVTSKHRELIINIATGIGYLHAQPFVHGDLHDSNIFINDLHQAILGDFGLTAIDESSDLAATTSINHAGAFRWTSPELICVDDTPPRKTAPGDVFAFGRLCLAVYTRAPPWHNITSNVNILMKVLNNEHPSRPSADDCHGIAIPDALWELMLSCWRTDHEARPDIEQIINSLQVIEFGCPDHDLPPHSTHARIRS